MSFQRLCDPTRSHPVEKLTIAPMQKITIQIHLSRSTAIVVVVDDVKDGEEFCSLSSRQARNNVQPATSGTLRCIGCLVCHWIPVKARRTPPTLHSLDVARLVKPTRGEHQLGQDNCTRIEFHVCYTTL